MVRVSVAISSKIDFFLSKGENRLTKIALAAKFANFRSKFVTDRQTNSLTPNMGVSGFFRSVKFAISLLPLLAGG